MVRRRFWRNIWGRDRGGSLQQNHLEEEFESGAPVKLRLDLIDAVDGALDAAGAPIATEPGGHGVEVSAQLECEAGEPG